MEWDKKTPLGRLGRLDKFARRVIDFFVRLVAERYLGTPVRLVGIDLTHSRCIPEKVLLCWPTFNL